MNWVLVGLGVTVIILMYVLYLYVYASSTNLATQLNLNTASVANTMAITSLPSAKNFAIGVWIYVNSVSSSVTYPILAMTGDGTYPLFYLSLQNTTLSLVLGEKSAGTSTTQSITMTTNFPLQSWTYVAFSVDSTYVDMYLNGKLLQSAKLIGMISPPTVTANIYAGQTLTSASAVGVPGDIMLAKLYRWTNTISPSEVWSQYLAGNGQSWGATKYGMNVGILQNNSQTASFRVI